MSQDTKTFLGFVIIALIVLVWMTYFSPAPPPKVAKAPVADSTLVRADTVARPAAPVAAEIPDSAKRSSSFGGLFAPFSKGDEKQTTIHTSLYDAVISSHGGALKQFQLSSYKTWNGYPVEMIDASKSSQINLLFESADGKLISTRDLFFTTNAPASVELHNDSTTLSFMIAIDSTRSIEKRFTFHDGTYIVDAEFVFTNCATVIGNYHYQVTWDKGIPFAEGNSIDECNSAEASAYQNGERETIDDPKKDSTYKRAISGVTNWVAIRNKYFAASMIAPVPADGAYLEGNRYDLPDNGAREEYSVALQFPYHRGAVESSKVKVFIGPMDYKLIKGLDVDLETIMSFGMKWVVRPIGMYFLMPVFNLLHSFIPNYGIVLIIFAFIIKALMTPLSIGQMKSSKKMQLLQPKMAELKEKLKDDPAKMQSESMKLYSTYGINPLGGCLPLLMQMPILFAMYPLFRNAISLRQSSFALWITDLSVPDNVLTLPFRIPIVSLDHISGLAVLMGVAIFLQQKMTTIQAPNQKAMMYMMPIMMPLMFASLPAGLNLYYVMFNVLSIFQQMWFNKKHSEIKLVPVNKENNGKPGKMGFTQRVLAAQKQAQNQNRNGSRKKK